MDTLKSLLEHPKGGGGRWWFGSFQETWKGWKIGNASFLMWMVPLNWKIENRGERVVEQ